MPQQVIGSWIPRTRLHLKEFYQFLEGDDLQFNKKTAAKHRKALNFSSVVYKDDTQDYIEAKKKGLTFRFFQDGIIYVVGTDKKQVRDFYEKKVLPAFSFIYARGASIPKLAADHTKKQRKVWTVGKDISSLELFEYALFMKEFEAALHAGLHVHRVVWDEISSIRIRTKIRFKDLPGIRDKLLEIKESITFFKTRISQMKSYVEDRKRLAGKRILAQLKKKKLDEFASLAKMETYMKDLLVMTEEYADTTLSMVTMLYSENEQRELNTLQIIFTIGVVASVLALGAMPGAQLLLRDASGATVLSGNISSFSLLDLFIYGVATLIIGSVVYFVLHYLFKEAKSFRIVSLVKKEESETRKIVKVHS